MRNRQKGGLPPAAATQPTPGSLAAGAADFLEHLAARAYSKGSIEAHQWALKGFLEWAESLDLTSPGSFTRATIETYQFHLHHYRSPRTKEPLGVNTQLGRLGCVRRFFAWLCRSGALPANPAADLDLPRKQSRRLPKALSPEELDRLFSLPNPADPMGLRDRTILELFYATGIRRTEMTQLDPGDYDPATNTLLIRHGKNDKSRLLPVGGRAAFWLDRFLAESRPLFDHLPNETAMFLSGYGTRITPAYLGTWVAGQIKKAGITKPGACHLLRHSMATDMHCNGADIRHVQEMLGHARLETTQIYTHVNIKALAEVHARTHPHGTLPKDHEHGYREPEPPEPSAPEPLTAPEPPPDIPPDPGSPPQPDGPLPTTPPAPVDSPIDSPCGTGGAVLGIPSAMQATHFQPCPTHPAVPKPPRPDENPPDPGPEPPSDRPTPPKPPKPFNPFTSNTLQQPAPAAEGGHVAFYGYRWYDPLTGRWPSRDPIGEDGGLNLYEMCHNSSISWFDGDGWQPATITITGVLGGTTKDEPNFTWTQESTYTGRTRTPNAKASFSMEFTITKEGCVINVVAKANFEIGASPRAYFKQKFADYSEPDGAELIEAIKVFNKGIAEKWNGKFKICCQSFSGIWVEKGIPATVTDSTKCCCDVKFSVAHDKNAMRVGVYKSATPYSDESNWNSQTNAQGVAAHEFGHLLGNIDENGQARGAHLVGYPDKKYGRQDLPEKPGSNIMSDEKGPVLERHLDRVMEGISGSTTAKGCKLISVTQ